MAYKEIYPNKIYVHRTIHLGLLSAAEIDITGSDVEYIRKGALLEWIQEARDIPHENAIVRDLAFQEIVNKVNKM